MAEQKLEYNDLDHSNDNLTDSYKLEHQSNASPKGSNLVEQDEVDLKARNNYTEERSPDLQVLSMVITQDGNEESPVKYMKKSPRKNSQEKMPTEISTNQRESFDFEKVLETEREKLAAVFQKEMQEKLEDLNNRQNEYWSNKHNQIQANYESKIMHYEELLKLPEGERSENLKQDIRTHLEKEIREKYHQQYLEKIEEIQQNFKAIEEDNLVQIVDEIKKQLEVEYEEKYNQQAYLLQNQAKQELERYRLERNNDTKNGHHDQDDFQKMLAFDVKASLEDTMRAKYENEKHEIIRKYTYEQDILRREINTMESKIKEKIEVQVEEELRKEYNKKEKLMTLNWKKKMESYKKSLGETLEQDMKGKLESERKSIEKSKIEINRLKSLENIRLKKAEENKKLIEVKLKEQEEKYERMINGLKSQINELKELSRVVENEDHPKASKGSKALNPSIRERTNSIIKLEHSERTRETTEPRGNSRPGRETGNGKGHYTDHSSHKVERLNSDPRSLSRGHSLGTSPVSVKKSGYDDRFLNAEKKHYLKAPPAQHTAALTIRSGIEITIKSQISEDISKVAMEILDPMAPPEFLWQDKPEAVNFQSGREREVNREQRKSIIQKPDSNTSYENLKAQIMKKYSPKRNDKDLSKVYIENQSNLNLRTSELEEQSQLEIRPPVPRQDRTFEFNSSNLSKKISVIEQYGRSEMNDDKTIVRDLNINNKLGGDSNDSFINKYESILKKYNNKENIGREKYKSPTSTKEGFYREPAQRDGDHTTRPNAYKALFDIKPEEDSKTKEMKNMKKAIERTIEKDNVLESEYLSREIYFTSEFLTKLDIDNTAQQKTLRNMFKSLYELWNDVETPFLTRISFLDSLDLMDTYETVMIKVTLEIDYLRVTQRNVGEIMDCMKKRDYYKEQIGFENFDYKKYKKLYFTIDANNIDMRKLIDPYKRKYNKEITYKGVEINDIIKLDSWEHSYLQKLEMKGEVMERIKRKKLLQERKISRNAEKA